MTWWGHSTVLLDDRARILTDPVLGSRVAHLVRRDGMRPHSSHLWPDVVLISHLHLDHLHLPSLRLLPRGTPVVLPRGGASLLAGCGVVPVEISAGECLDLEGTGGPVSVQAVHAEHDGGRGPWSRVRGPALGYVVAGRRRTYVAGDTDLFDTMADIGDLGLDLALLPVGGWGLTVPAGHLRPSTAAQAVRRLRPRVVVPVHYATFWPRGLQWARPHLFARPGPLLAELVGDSADVRVIPPGSSTTVD